MKVNVYVPHPALHAHVLNLSTIDVSLPDGMQDVVTPYPPTPFQSLLFYCNDPVSMGKLGQDVFQLQPHIVLLGPQYSRVNVKVHHTLRAIRVDFMPGGLYRMLGIPMHEMFDTGFDALDFFGPDMKALNERLQHCKHLEEGKTMVEQFLLKHVGSLKTLLPTDRAFKTLVQSHGTIGIETVASLSCLSLKQFERQCRERLGMNPKLYARILRFSKAYRIHEAFPEFKWIQIAHEAGYYDQMHMIKDFKLFAGVNPSVIEAQLRSTPLRMQKDLPG